MPTRHRNIFQNLRMPSFRSKERICGTILFRSHLTMTFPGARARPFLNRPLTHVPTGCRLVRQLYAAAGPLRYSKLHR